MNPMYGMGAMLKQYMNGGMMEYPGGGMVPKRMKYADGTMLTGDGDPEKEGYSSPSEELELLAARPNRRGIAYGSSANTAQGLPGGGYTTVTESTAAPILAAMLGLDEPEAPRVVKEVVEKDPGGDLIPKIPPKKPTVKKSFRKKDPDPVGDPVDFSGGKSGYEFMPTFDGNSQQTGARGEGSSGALSGVAMYFKGDDGRMEKVNTRLEDVPEYITKDPYFERLLEKANRNYFELEREGGAAKASQARKSAEAQMIGRILSGDITIEEAKRQANFQRQSF